MGTPLRLDTCLAAALQELLVPLVTDNDVKIDIAGFAALSLGLVFTSTCNGDAIEAIIQALMMRGELELSSPFAKFLALGLGLLFLGRQEAVEPTVEVIYFLASHVSRQIVVRDLGQRTVNAWFLAKPLAKAPWFLLLEQKQTLLFSADAKLHNLAVQQSSGTKSC